MHRRGACGLESSGLKLPTRDLGEWSKLNADQQTSWGPWFVALLICQLSGMNTKHGIMVHSACHEDCIRTLQAGQAEEVFTREAVLKPRVCGTTWITMGRRWWWWGGGVYSGPKATELQLREDVWVQMNGVPQSEHSHHHTGISLYPLNPSLPLLLSGVAELPRLHSLEPDWRGSPLLLTSLIYLGYLWELGWKLPY